VLRVNAEGMRRLYNRAKQRQAEEEQVGREGCLRDGTRDTAHRHVMAVRYTPTAIMGNVTYVRACHMGSMPTGECLVYDAACMYPPGNDAWHLPLAVQGVSHASCHLHCSAAYRRRCTGQGWSKPQVQFQASTTQPTQLWQQQPPWACALACHNPAPCCMSPLPQLQQPLCLGTVVCLAVAVADHLGGSLAVSVAPQQGRQEPTSARWGAHARW
jgi:hypothetical protein